MPVWAIELYAKLRKKIQTKIPEERKKRKYVLF